MHLLLTVVAVHTGILLTQELLITLNNFLTASLFPAALCILRTRDRHTLFGNKGNKIMGGGNNRLRCHFCANAELCEQY